MNVSQLYPDPGHGSAKLLMGSGGIETTPGAANLGYESYLPDSSAVPGSDNPQWILGEWDQTHYLSQADTVSGVSDALYGSPVYSLAAPDGTSGLSVYNGPDGNVFDLRQTVTASTWAGDEEDLSLSTAPVPQSSDPSLDQPIQVSADFRIKEADATLPGISPMVYGGCTIGIVVTFNSSGLALSADERPYDTVFLQSGFTDSRQGILSTTYLNDTADAYTRTAIYDDPAGATGSVPFMAAGTATAFEWNVNALLADFLATGSAGFEDPAFRDMSRWSLGGIYIGSAVSNTEAGLGFQGSVNLEYQLSDVHVSSQDTVTGVSAAVPVAQSPAPVFDFLDTNTGWSAQVKGVYDGADSDYVFSGTDSVTVWSDPSLSRTDPGNSWISGDTAFMVSRSSGETTLSGMQGTVTVHGGSSAEVIFSGAAGRNRVTAGSGNATLIGSVSDVLSAGSGTDLIFSGSGANTVYGGNGASTVVSSSGNDLIAAGSSPMVVFAGSGRDTVFGGSSASVFVGGSGSSALVGGSADDTIWGGSAPGVIYGGSGHQLLAGGTGDATISGGSGTSTLLGGSGHDLMTAGLSGDVIFGGSGADTIIGSAAGTSTIAGSSAGMLVVGSGGRDVVWGGSGNDTIFGGTAGDFVATGSGTDAVVLSGASRSQDTVRLGSGSAAVYEGSGPVVYQVEKGFSGGTDLIVGFMPGTDQVMLTGYGPSAPLQQSVSGGPTGATLSLADGTRLVFSGLKVIDVSLFMAN